MIEHYYAVGLECLLHKMRNVHNGRACGTEAIHNAHYGPASAYVEQRAGLVEYEYAGLEGKCACDCHPLLLASRESCGIRLGVFREGHATKLALDAKANLCRRHAEVLGAKCNVLIDDGGYDLVIGILEHEPELATCATIGPKIDGLIS